MRIVRRERTVDAASAALDVLRFFVRRGRNYACGKKMLARETRLAESVLDEALAFCLRAGTLVDEVGTYHLPPNWV